MEPEKEIGLVYRDSYLKRAMGLDMGQTEGGIVHFESMGLNVAKHCLKNGWLNPEESQNDSPTVAQIIAFMERCPSFSAHGYVVAATRKDARISFEGVQAFKKPTRKELDDFILLFRGADDFSLNPPFAWFD